MKVDGRCHCGKISFEAEIDTAAVSICHCTDCQQLGGTAFRVNVPASAEHVVLRGEVKSYLKTAESGRVVRHGFCGDCGTPIFSCAPEAPARYNLRIGTIAQRASLVPRRQSWRRSALPWLEQLGDIPHTEKGA